jgi:hypothetical protein
VASPAQRSKEQKPAEHKTADSATKPPAPKPAPVDDKETPVQKQAPQQEPDGPAPLWRDKNIQSWALVIVGFLAALAATLTLVAIKEQTKATATAADAARKSADALIDIERPWVLITVERPDYRYIKMDGEDTLRYTGGWRMRNFGRTPARITHLAGTFECLEELSFLPKTPVYLHAPEIDVQILAPTGNQTEDEGLSVTIPYTDEKLPEGLWTELKAGKKKLVFYGFVAYEDPFGRKHETRFCYALSTKWLSFIDIAGPPEYNKQT